MSQLSKHARCAVYLWPKLQGGFAWPLLNEWCRFWNTRRYCLNARGAIGRVGSPCCSAVCILCLHTIDFQYMCQQKGGQSRVLGPALLACKHIAQAQFVTGRHANDDANGQITHCNGASMLQRHACVTAVSVQHFWLQQSFTLSPTSKCASKWLDTLSTVCLCWSMTPAWRFASRRLTGRKTLLLSTLFICT